MIGSGSIDHFATSVSQVSQVVGRGGRGLTDRQDGSIPIFSFRFSFSTEIETAILYATKSPGLVISLFYCLYSLRILYVRGDVFDPVFSCLLSIVNLDKNEVFQFIQFKSNVFQINCFTTELGIIKSKL